MVFLREGIVMQRLGSSVVDALEEIPLQEFL